MLNGALAGGEVVEKRFTWYFLREKRADVEHGHIDEQVEEKDDEECSAVSLMRASWRRVIVTAMLSLRSTYTVQSPHWRFRWRRCNNRRNMLNGRVAFSANSELDEKRANRSLMLGCDLCEVEVELPAMPFLRS